PVLGFGLRELLSGAEAREVTPFGTPGDPDAATLGDKLPGDTSFLQRIFEEGPNGFRLADIGRTITSTAGLRQFLDDLDDTPNNVTLTEAGGVTRYDVRINKTLDGSADFAVDALDGQIDLAGA